jgi:hypothetical protein
LHIMRSALRDMQRGQPPLLPLLRSRQQADLLTLVLEPGQKWMLSEVASGIRSTVSSVQREVVRAEQAGVLASRWAVSEAGSCRQAPGGHLVCFHRPSGLASPATRVDASTRDAAGSESSYLALTLAEAIRVVTVK